MDCKAFEARADALCPRAPSAQEAPLPGEDHKHQEAPISVRLLASLKLRCSGRRNSNGNDDDYDVAACHGVDVDEKKMMMTTIMVTMTNAKRKRFGRLRSNAEAKIANAKP